MATRFESLCKSLAMIVKTKINRNLLSSEQDYAEFVERISKFGLAHNIEFITNDKDNDLI